MTQEMVDNYNAFGVDFKTSIENMVEDNGIHGEVKVFDTKEDFVNAIMRYRIDHYNNDNSSVFAKNQRKNKWFASWRDVSGFFDATEYVRKNGDLDYLTNFLRYGGLVRLGDSENEFIGLTQDTRMREAVTRLINKE